MDRSQPYRIHARGSQPSETLRYAAEELRKYLALMAGDGSEVRAARADERPFDIELGLFSDFSDSGAGGAADLDPLDDAVDIRVRGGRGTITGSNPRSVLFAVYRFLEQNGCRWIRPGPDGEIVPRRSLELLEATVSERASSRFRGFNNCGAESLERIVEKIEWAPKVGLNTVLLEYLLSSTLQQNWYRHDVHSLSRPESRSQAELLSYHETAVREIKKRGLLLQAVGHGWTGAFFGLTDFECSLHGGLMKDLPREHYERKVPEEEKRFLALVKGERRFHDYGPLFTELCYGEPEVRRRLAARVADYAEAHPEVDILHFWLSDITNRFCECEQCRTTRPGDFYVMILNAIDEELARRGLATSIAFLLYHGLLWAPERQRLRNPDRFVLMLAPGGRRYHEAYALRGDESLLASFAYNANSDPDDIRGFIASLEAWRSGFGGPGFVFDYHMCVYHYYDLGCLGFCSVLAEDLRRLAAIGLHGSVACQIVRSYSPTAYPLHLQARMLWNPRTDTDALAAEYFAAAFGDDGPACRTYLDELSARSHRDHFFCASAQQMASGGAEVAADLARIPEVIERMRPVIERNLVTETDPCRKTSWALLHLHAEIALSLAHALRALAEGRQVLADIYYTRAVEYIVVNERRLEPYFDQYWFYMAFETWHRKFSYRQDLPGLHPTAGGRSAFDWA